MLRQIYLSVSGRCSRRFYWQFFVVPLTVVGVLWGLLALALNRRPDIFLRLSVLIGLLLVWPCAVMYIKRWHDAGLSGWFAVLNFVPGLSLVMWLVLGCIPGTSGPNRYGPDPAVPSRPVAL